MYDHSLFLRTVSEFSGRLLTPYDVDTVLRDLMARLSEIFGLVGSGTALAEEGTLRSWSGIPTGIDALEQIQGEEQAGPCVDAFHSGEPVVVTDLAEVEERWPSYVRAARKQDVTSVVGLPLRLSGTAIGAVNLYAGEDREWSAGDLEAAVVLADMVTAYLVNASKVRQSEQLAEQLQAALESRTVIEQAKGVIAARQAISVDEAFELIRAHARSRSVTVRAVSDAIVNLGLHL